MDGSFVPPPAPPPPACVGTATVLGTGGRAPTNSERVVSLRPTVPSKRPSPLASIQPETLRHAALHLRKTQYREPLLSSEFEQFLDGQDQLAPGRYRPDLEKHDPLAVNQTGAAIHAPTADSMQPAPVYLQSEYRNSMSPEISRMKQPSQILVETNSAGTRQIPIQIPTIVRDHLPTSTFLQDNNAPPPPPPVQTQWPRLSSSTTNNIGGSSHQNNTPSPVQSFTSSALNYGATTKPPQQATNNNYTIRSVPIKKVISDQSQQPPLPPPPPQQQPSVDLFRAEPVIVTNPQFHIHKFATETPAAAYANGRPLWSSSTSTGGSQPQNQAANSSAAQHNGNGGGPSRLFSNQQTAPHVESNRQTDFARELRDSTLTERQKFLNQQSKSFVQPADRPLPSYTDSRLFQQQNQPKSGLNGRLSELDDLVQEMEWRLKTGYTSEHRPPTPNDYCTKCRKPIVGDTPGVTALGNAYHVTCFCCDECRKQLAGCSFYSVDGKNLCQVDYMNSLEKCHKCKTPITQKILRALGNAFHPECFVCPGCDKSLDGIPFTVDKSNTPYCLNCYHERFSPRCAVCLKAIAPSGNETEVARVIAMERSYHVDCYRCEDCGLKLNSKIEGQGCYPLESHLFCRNCNIQKLKTVK